MVTYFECNNCGFFHKEAYLTDCKNPATRFTLAEVPTDFDHDYKVLYLTKEQGGKYYDEPKDEK